MVLGEGLVVTSGTAVSQWAEIHKTALIFLYFIPRSLMKALAGMSSRGMEGAPWDMNIGGIGLDMAFLLFRKIKQKLDKKIYQP